MKQFYTALLALVFTCSFSVATAQLTNFSFAGAAGDEATWPSGNSPTTEFTYLKRGPGITPYAFGSHFGSIGWTTSLQPDLDDYLEFTVVQKPGAKVNIVNLDMQHFGAELGPKYFVVRTSIDDFTDNATNVVYVNDLTEQRSSNFLFSSPIVMGNAPLIIRLYAFGSETEDDYWGPGGSNGTDLGISSKQMGALSAGFSDLNAQKLTVSILLN